MSKRRDEKVRDRVRAEIQAILDKYPNGREYDRTELLLDVRHDLDQMKKRLGLSPDVPIRVYLDEGVLVVKFGIFSVN